MSLITGAPRAMSHGLRWSARRPLASLISAVCLGVGLAAFAVAWTLIDATIARPLGLEASNRLVVVWEADPARGHELIEVSHLNFLDWQMQAKTLESMAAFGSSPWPALARIGSETVPLAARAVSNTFFATLGIQPKLGRDFAPSDHRRDAIAPVILSHRLWQSRFASSQAIVDQVLFIDGAEHRIIGVMPRGFAYPDDPDAWISVERTLAKAFENIPLDRQRSIGVLGVVGRKRPGVSDQHVRDELSTIIGNLRLRYDPAGGQVSATVNRFTDGLLGRLGPRLWLAFAMAALVLLFACANVAAVRMAQFRERAAELAARLFLGSSRSRLAADLAFEAVPLVIGAFASALLMWSGLVAALSSASVVAESGVTLAPHRGMAALVFTMPAFFSWLLVGVIPAWRASRRSASETLASWRVSHRTTVVGAPLLSGQAAAAIVVVAVAASVLQAFDHLSRTDVGFARSGVTLVDTMVPEWKYESPADRRRLTGQLQDALRQLPGVTHVAAVSLRPFRFGEIVDGVPVRREADALVQPGDATGGNRVVTTPDYFAALGQPITEGRHFSELDRLDTEAVVIVSRTLARALWGHQPAVGKRLEMFTLADGWRPRLVVGIAGDARYRGLERPSMELYVPHMQASTELGTYVIATEQATGLGEAVVRQAMRRVEPDIAFERIQTTRELVQSVLSPARLLATLVSLLGAAGLLLLTLGIFGAAAAALRAAWAEIAVRQAIGAMPFQAARAPLGLLGRALAIGIGVGLLVSPLALSVIEVAGIKTTGIAMPLLIGAFAVVAAASLAAGPLIRRAARTSPAQLLREN